MPQNADKYKLLREKYKNFIFHSTEAKWLEQDRKLELVFHFSIEDSFHFYPSHTIHFPYALPRKRLPKTELHSLAFHLGMVELISYWKAACPPQVIIKEYALTEAQKRWWKKLYFQGLGEFFYTNGIELNAETFMHIHSSSKQTIPVVELADFGDSTVIVPIGGGKDSIVSIEVLKTLQDKTLVPLIINPRLASQKTVENAGFSLQDSIIIHRTIHPTLLELNRQDFLNGHTPFSAMLAFACLLTAQIMQLPYIALSNESSANEATVPGTNINHQYSKSFEFEEDFRQYYQAYINNNTHYFSLLRPLNELQIAALFSQYNWHHSDFKSCNVGSKTDSWCCQCPKCLFTYLMLCPFLPKQDLKTIFGSSLLEKEQLKHILDKLRGVTDVKPFECVGTIEEVNIALGSRQHSYDKDTLLLTSPKQERLLSATLAAWNKQHALPSKLEQSLKQAIKDLTKNLSV